MNARLFFFPVAISAILSGCAGVPELYKPARINGDTVLAPKVENIVDRLTCELADASRKHLAGKDYVITVVLSLQVNDDLNLTPSLSFIDVLPVASTNRTFTQNTGIGGSRERQFTSTFTYNSKDLQATDVAGCTTDSKKLYRLDGNLGIAEIVRDGIGIGTRQAFHHQNEPPVPPSFASQVKFVVTRSVNALGPTWNLVSFKGPGGANGLLNGKALNTDSVNIAFAVKKEPPPSLATKAQLEELLALARSRAEREREATDDLGRKQDLLALVVAAEAQKANGPRFKSMAERERSRQMVERAKGALREAEQKKLNATAERVRADTALEEARQIAGTLAAANAESEALLKGQQLITTMILQTLNVQPR